MKTLSRPSPFAVSLPVWVWKVCGPLACSFRREVRHYVSHNLSLDCSGQARAIVVSAAARGVRSHLSAYASARSAWRAEYSISRAYLGVQSF